MKKILLFFILSLLLLLAACAGDINNSRTPVQSDSELTDQSDSAPPVQSNSEPPVQSDSEPPVQPDSELTDGIDNTSAVSSYIPKDRGYGQIADFSTIDLNGGTVTQSVFSDNEVTFINYWATWCGPCRAELPDFPGMYEKYRDQVTFITIVDDGENNDTAISIAEQYLSGYVNLLPTAELVRPIQSGYVPTSVIVDSGGYLLVDKIIGAVGDYSSYIDTALEVVNG